MGAEPSRPTEKQAKELHAGYTAQCKAAAAALRDADVILLCTGAGFSADSGLAVYADIAKVKAYKDRGLTYSDICVPAFLHEEPAFFYGFWGMCFNDYRATQPHEGYNIIARWRDATNKKPAARAIRKKLLDDMGKGKGKDPVAMTAELESDEALSLYYEARVLSREANNAVLAHFAAGTSASPEAAEAAVMAKKAKVLGQKAMQLDDSVEHRAAELDEAKCSAEALEALGTEPYSVEGAAAGFYVFTSNVDAHSFDVFSANEIRECHGNVEVWQCADQDCKSGLWRTPTDYRYHIDIDTMCAMPYPSHVDGAGTDPHASRSDGADSADGLAGAAGTLSSGANKGAGKSSGKGPDKSVGVGAGKGTAQTIGNTRGKGRTHPLRYMGTGTTTGTTTGPRDKTSLASMRPLGNAISDIVDDINHAHAPPDTGFPSTGFPHCPTCKGLARPAIMMFGDFTWKDNAWQCNRFNAWTNAVIDTCTKGVSPTTKGAKAVSPTTKASQARASHANDTKGITTKSSLVNGAKSAKGSTGKAPIMVPRVKVVVVEVGAGDKITTVRHASESFMRDVTEANGSATLIRISPDLPLADNHDLQDSTISIMSYGLNALLEIDKHMKATV